MKTLFSTVLFCFIFLITIGQKWKHFAGTEYLPVDTILCLGNAGDSLLVGTKNGAGVRYRGQTTFLTTSDGLAANQVDRIAGSDSGEVLMYHHDASILTWIESNGNIQTYSLSATLTDTVVYDLIYNTDGYFYLNNGDIWAFKADSFINVARDGTPIASGPKDCVYSLYSSGKIVKFKNASAVDTIQRDTALNIGFARFIYSNGKEVYFTSFPSATFQVFENHIDSLSSSAGNEVKQLFPDSKGRLWRVEKTTLSRGKSTYESTSTASINHAFRVEVFPTEVNDSIFIAVDNGFIAAPLDVKFHSTSFLKVNDFNFKINPEGTVGSTEFDESLLSPQGFNKQTLAKIDGVNVLFASGLWLAGITNQGDTLDAGERYSGIYPSAELTPFDFDLSTGPRATSYEHSRNYTAHITTKRDRMIHQLSITQPGYILPGDFIDWPAHGVPQSGEAGCLAPFIDVDNDGKYIPQAGDYPQIRGDAAAYTISNDDYLRQFFPNTPMGLEIHRMFYGYESSDPTLKNTLFLNIRMVNRGNHDFSSFRWGVYNDFDLGNAWDDYIGCDTALNMAFVYNGDNQDEDAGNTKGFGYSPPAFGLMLLNDQMKSHLDLYRRARPGIRSLPTNPKNAAERYNLLSGKYAEGFPLLDTLANGERSTFRYYGSPLDPNAPSEPGNGNTPYDKKTLLGGSEHALSPGDTLEFDLAFVFAENPSTEGAEAYSALAAQAEAVQNWFNNQTFEPWQTACTPISVGTREQEKTNTTFKLYPNPAENEIRISGMEGSFSYRIFNLQGQIVQSGKSSQAQPIQILEMNSGVYFIQINQKEVRKFIVR